MSDDVTWQEASAEADAMLAVAGHEVSDARLRELARQMFEGEISHDEGNRLVLDRIQELRDAGE